MHRPEQVPARHRWWASAVSRVVNDPDGRPRADRRATGTERADGEPKAPYRLARVTESPLPTFAPGPRSRVVLRRPAPPRRAARPPRRRARRAPAAPAPLEITHGTTVVAIRYADGVVMAGDRRATAGYTIASRRIEKVFPADDFSGVAIAGAAGPAVEMVQAVPGAARALREDRRARRSRSRARPTSSARWCAATSRPRCRASRSCRSSPATTTAATAAGCSATTSPAASTRSRLPDQRLGRRARPQLDQGARGSEGMTRDDTVDLALALAVRGRRRGHRHRRTRPRPAHLPDGRGDRRRRLTARRPTTRSQPVRGALRRPRGGERAVSMPFYVSPEQVMKDRADYARKGIARGRSLVAFSVRRRHRDRRREPVPHALQDQRDLRPHRVRRRRQVQRVRDAARRRRAPGRPQGLLVRPRGRERAGARQRVRADARPGVHPRDEAVRGRDPRRGGRARPSTTTSCTTSSTTASSWTKRASTVLGGQAEQIAEALEIALRRRASTPAPPSASAPRCSRDRTPCSPPTSSRSRSSTGRVPARVPPHQGRRARWPSSTPAEARRHASARSAYQWRSAPATVPSTAITSSTRRHPARPASARARPIGAGVPPVAGRGERGVDLVDEQHVARASSSWSSGTYTSTRAMSPTVSP